MENKLPTQQKLNDAQARAEKKEEIIKTIKNNLNYIYVVLMIIANCIISLLRIDGGDIGLRYPSSFWGWCLWLLEIFITTFIGVMIMNAFRRQGIKKGHTIIKNTYDKYLESIAHGEENSNPRGLKEYLKKQTLKDGFSRGVILVLINLLVISLAISLNTNSLLALITNIIFSIGFGIKTMLDAEEYVVTELVVWYNKRIEQNNKKGEENGRTKKRNSKSRVGHTKSSGIQQAEEPGTGHETSCSIEPGQRDNISETVGLSS